MHAAVRPYVTTGIALVGASVITVTSITPATPPDMTPPHIGVASPAVELTVSYDPWPSPTVMIQQAVTNTTILTQEYLTEPLPIVHAILGQPVTAPTDILTALGWVGQSAVSAVAAGAVGAAIGITILNPFVPIANFFPFPLNLIVGVILFPVGLSIGLFNIGVLIADGVLNGASETPFGPLSLPGILTPGSNLGDPAMPMPGLIGSLIALDQAIGAAISSIFHPTSTPLAPANEPPKSGVTTFTLNTAPEVNSVSKPGDSASAKTGSDITSDAQRQPQSATAGPAGGTNGPAKTDGDNTSQAEQRLDTAAVGMINTGPDTTNPAQHELETTVPGAANATDALAQARSNASTQGQDGLDTATSAINNASTGIRDGNKVQPDQEGRNSAPSGDDAVKTAKPAGDQADSTPSKTGNETENDQSNSSVKGSKG